MATVTQPTEASVREQHLKTKRLAWEAWSAIPSTSDVAAHKAAELVKLIAAEKVLCLFTHLTLPTKRIVSSSVVAVSFKNKNNDRYNQRLI